MAARLLEASPVCGAAYRVRRRGKHSFSKPSTPILPPVHKLLLPLGSNPRTHQRLRISSGLIEPDGGKLVELFVSESARARRRGRLQTLPTIKLL
ncbi:hypothetical protein M0R45_007911 [Rubus argutus]|uniref:Uncharacterized protein n=1 Tax=Rubus argutus TaxID=59490 RepID=A0AAW1Y1N4_RUBAR